MMFKTAVYLWLALVLTLGLVLTGCDPQTTTIPPQKTENITFRGNTGGIQTGKAEKLVAKTIPSAGGTVAVSQTGNAIDGLTLEVTAGSYTGAVDFTIFATSIEKQTFGEYCNPLTPLITVTGSEDFSDEVMRITVPVKVPEGQFAMGFIYDDETGTLTGMNTVAQDAGSITLATRHFCSFFMSAVDKTLLTKDIDSGFLPGEDDWQFTNRGSYLEQGGHCAGQSVTAIWYYVNHPDGEKQKLWRRYDNNGEEPATPKLDYDDSLAYRFVSVVHHDINWKSFENKFWYGLSGKSDATTFNLFAYAMLATKQPQEIGIFSNSGGGHDMVCYRIKDGKFYIADPNYPGDRDRKIEFNSNNMTFSPYNTGLNKEEIEKGNGKDFEVIQFCNKTDTISWTSIAARWREMKAGTIGDNLFPDYKVVYKDNQGKLQELADGFISPDAKLSLGAINTDGKTKIESFLYKDGAIMPGSSKAQADLVPGTNKIGIYVVVPVEKRDKDGKPYTVGKFVDFVYYNIIYNPLSIEPGYIEANTDESVFFTAKGSSVTEGNLYIWKVDDLVIQEDTLELFITDFLQAGTYNIELEMVDYETGESTFAKAVAVIAVASPTTTPPTTTPENRGKPEIGFQKIYVDYQVTGWFYQETAWGDPSEAEKPLSDSMNFENLTWNGHSFEGDNGSYTISGAVDNDNTISFVVVSTYINKGEWKFSTWGIPYNTLTRTWFKKGVGLQDNVSVVYCTRTISGYWEMRHLVWDIPESGDLPYVSVIIND
jgi:hypothetical protein